MYSSPIPVSAMAHHVKIAKVKFARIVRLFARHAKFQSDLWNDASSVFRRIHKFNSLDRNERELEIVRLIQVLSWAPRRTTYARLRVRIKRTLDVFGFRWLHVCVGIWAPDPK